MAFPSVTYTFTNNTAADAGQVNTNFTDIINGLSDGSKDLNISAITAAGTVTLNGNVLLGNALGDDVQFNGSLATSIPIKTTRSYDIGSADLGLRICYLGMNSTHTIALQAPSSGASADYSLTLPATVPSSGGQALVNLGNGVTSWSRPLGSVSAQSGDYTITDTDGVGTVLVTTGASDRTITLPTAADNSGRVITIKKVDSGAGKVIIDGENAEAIDGAATYTMYVQYDAVTIICDGTAWAFVDKDLVVNGQIRLDTGNGRGSTNIYIRRFTNTTSSSGSSMTYADSATLGMTITINQPGVYAFTYHDATAASGSADAGISLNSASLTTRIQSISAAERLAYGYIGANTVPALCAVTVRLAVGDVIRAHTTENSTSTANYVQFTATQVARF